MLAHDMARLPGLHPTSHTRRAFLRATALGGATLLGLAACGPSGSPTAGRWTHRYLTVATTGGALRQSLWQAAFVPFQQATGCQVMDVNLSLDVLVPALRRQVLTGQTQWDAVALDAPTIAGLASVGPVLFEQLNRDTLSQLGLPAEDISPHGASILLDTLGLAYRTAPYAGRVPAAWPEVWDTSPAGFPGPRLFPANPVGLLEVALLADGVAPDPRQLYPLDLDRAFRSLERLRPAIADWWQPATRPGDALTQGEADLVLAPTGSLRAAIAGGAIAALAPVPQPQLALALALPLRAPNGDVAQDFLSFSLGPDVQAAFAGQGYRPAIPGSASASPATEATFPLDLGWWQTNWAVASERLTDWISR
jgi:putative spermidine/putrescine transport system substrate-binding protein